MILFRNLVLILYLLSPRVFIVKRFKKNIDTTLLQFDCLDLVVKTRIYECMMYLTKPII